MNMLRKLSLKKMYKRLSRKCLGAIKKSLTAFKAALIGCLMICVSLISGCQSASKIPAGCQKVAIDASLMVEPSYTNQMLKLLSE